MTAVVITTLGGLGMFILGMKMMTDGLQMSAGKRIKSILSAVSSNRVVGFVTGGFMTLLRSFINNAMAFDENHQMFVGKSPMHQARGEHAILLIDKSLYVFGGITQQKGGKHVALNSAEMYSMITDQWIKIPPFKHARHAHSCCSFNDKWIFLFGGKRTTKDSWQFVQEIEVFEVEKGVWSEINYIDKSKFNLLNPGCLQVTGKKIMIFGGKKSFYDQKDMDEDLENENTYLENGKMVTITPQVLMLDVTNGSLKKQGDMVKPAYFISGCDYFTHDGDIYAMGF